MRHPGPGEVLVRVLAAGVNNTDINTREGWYSAEVTGATGETSDGVEAGGWSGALRFPLIQGGDLCGEVVALGEGVTTPALGARVTCPINIPRPTPDNPVGFIALGSEIDGAFADYCLMAAADLYDVTDAPLSDIEIAAIPAPSAPHWACWTAPGSKRGKRCSSPGPRATWASRRCNWPRSWARA